MAAIRIFRPKQPWSASPATLLPTGLVVRFFRPHWNFTVVLDGHPAGKIGYEQEKVFNVDTGEHRLRLRFVLLRWSKEMRMSLKEGEERQFICGSSGMGWPTLREASPEEVAENQGASVTEAPKPGGPVPPK